MFHKLNVTVITKRGWSVFIPLPYINKMKLDEFIALPYLHTLYHATILHLQDGIITTWSREGRHFYTITISARWSYTIFIIRKMEVDVFIPLPWSPYLQDDTLSIHLQDGSQFVDTITMITIPDRWYPFHICKMEVNVFIPLPWLPNLIDDTLSTSARWKPMCSYHYHDYHAW